MPSWTSVAAPVACPAAVGASAAGTPSGTARIAVATSVVRRRGMVAGPAALERRGGIIPPLRFVAVVPRASRGPRCAPSLERDRRAVTGLVGRRAVVIIDRASDRVGMRRRRDRGIERARVAVTQLALGLQRLRHVRSSDDAVMTAGRDVAELSSDNTVRLSASALDSFETVTSNVATTLVTAFVRDASGGTLAKFTVSPSSSVTGWPSHRCPTPSLCRCARYWRCQ